MCLYMEHTHKSTRIFFFKFVRKITENQTEYGSHFEEIPNVRLTCICIFHIHIHIRVTFATFSKIKIE